MMGWEGGMVGLGWGGMAFGVLLWLFVVGLVVWALASIFPPTRAQPAALDELKRRYARGELSEAQYHEALEALR